MTAELVAERAQERHVRLHPFGPTSPRATTSWFGARTPAPTVCSPRGGPAATAAAGRHEPRRRHAVVDRADRGTPRRRGLPRHDRGPRLRGRRRRATRGAAGGAMAAARPVALLAVALAAYAVTVAAGTLAMVRDESLRPSYQHSFFTEHITLIAIALAIGQFPLLLLHEGYHALAARRRGPAVDVRHRAPGNTTSSPRPGSTRSTACRGGTVTCPSSPARSWTPSAWPSSPWRPRPADISESLRG